MSVYLSRGAVCEEDARVVCLTEVYACSPSLFSCALHWLCTQQQGITVALQGHLLAGLGAGGWFQFGWRSRNACPS